MKWKWVLLFGFFIFGIISEIQAQKKLESLLTVLQNSNKENKIKNLENIALYYKELYSYTKAIEYYNTIVTIAEGDKNIVQLAKTYNDIGRVYNNYGDYNKGLIYANKALTEIGKTDNPKLLAEIYTDLATVFINLSIPDSVFFYTNKSLAINQTIHSNEGLANNYFYLGKLEGLKGSHKVSLNYFEKALDFVKRIDNKKMKAQILSSISSIYMMTGNYPKSMDICMESLLLTEKNGYKDLSALIYTFLGTNYKKIGQVDKALECFEKAKAIFDEIGETGGNLGTLYNEFGSVYDLKKDYLKALAFKEKSVAIHEKSGHTSSLIPGYTNIGVTLHFLGRLIPAMNYYQKGLQLAYQYKDSSTLSVVLNNMGEVYRDAPDSVLEELHVRSDEKYIVALATFNKSLAIAKKINYPEVEKTVWENISITYEQQKDFAGAFAAYKNFVVVKDKILNDKIKQKINRLEIQYEYNKKEDSIKLEQTLINNKLQQQQFLNQQQAQNILLQRNKLLLSGQQLALTNKEKDLQHLAYLKTQADLQTEQLQKSEQNKLLLLTQNEKALQASQVKTLSQENDLNKLRHRQQLLYGIAGFAILLFAGLFFLNRNRHKQAQLKADLAKEKAEQQQKEAEFQRSLADVSLSALRSQMNPHFIFNCLNSIKLYTTQNETAEAANYLTKFSKLIRMALENSRSETVTLQSELESLDLYIQMEAMRFKEKLKYSITVDENVDSSFIEIPPLLLQPYVENAIWHGLMHKEEGGHIKVNVKQLTEESVLVISIQDDGVGREQAALLRGKTTATHKSYGTKVTAERLALINQVYKTEASVTTTDVINNAGAIAGTLVTIKIPFE